jgi:hypothetical protein
MPRSPWAISEPLPRGGSAGTTCGTRRLRQAVALPVSLEAQPTTTSGSGSCGVPRPSLAHYVTGIGPMDGATAAGGVRVAYPPDAVSSFLFGHLSYPPSDPSSFAYRHAVSAGFESPVRSTTHDLRVEHLKVGLLRTCFLDRHDVDSLRLSRNPSRSPAEFWPNTDRIAVELGLG